MLVVIVPVLVGLIVRFNVTTESHPAAFVNVSRYVPAVVTTEPLKIKEPPGQMLVVIEPVLVALALKFKVRNESQPT
jgi:hypothetical protein